MSDTGRAFLDIFRELNMTGEQHALFDETKILRCATNREQDFLRIYLQSTHLIPGRQIRENLGLKDSDLTFVLHNYKLLFHYCASR